MQYMEAAVPDDCVLLQTSSCSSVMRICSCVVLMMMLNVMSSGPAMATDRRRTVVSLAVSSTTDGWSLRVDGCPFYPSVDGPGRCGPHPRPEQKTTGGPQESKKGTSNKVVVQDNGITLTVLNQRDASVIFHKLFPLDRYWAHWSDLQWHLQHVAAGRIVIMTVSISGIIGLRHAIQKLVWLGSLFVEHLPPRARWTWVFIKGGRTISETAVLQGDASQNNQLIIPLSQLPLPQLPVFAAKSYLETLRWQYCAVHGAMGGLCDEINPDPLPPLPPPPLPSTMPRYTTHALNQVPVIVTAGSRHQYLYHCLRCLLAANGALHENILVVVGNEPPSTIQLLQLVNVSYATLPLQGPATNDKLFVYYRSVFRLIADRFADASAVILLDEDIEVSPDFFSFMSQTLWLLKVDPTLYCINAHSALGFKGFAHNDTQVMRGTVQVEWGYAVTLDFVREALAVWETITTPNTAIYDFWLYMNIRKDRECLFPEVSRTLHYGMGVNSDAYLMEKGPLMMPLAKQAPVVLQDVASLQLSAWQKDLTQSISQAIPLSSNPCTSTFLPQYPSSSSYVFYYRLDELKESAVRRPDPYQYYHVTECLGLWSLSEQGHHEGVTIIRFAPNSTLYLVGVPYSRFYSHLRPRTLPLWDIDALDDQEFKKVNEYTNKRESEKMKIVNENITSDTLVETLVGT